MQTSHTSYIKGLSIAVIVFAALGIVGAFASFALTGIGTALISDYAPSAIDSAHDYGYHHGLEYQYGMDGQQAADLTATLLATVGTAFSIWALLCHGVMLLSGIIGLRYASNPAKLGLVFGWGVGGAVAALLSGSFISMVLLIILAVFAQKDRAEAATAGAPVGTAPAATAAPVAAPVAAPAPAAANPNATATAAAPVAASPDAATTASGAEGSAQ